FFVVLSLSLSSVSVRFASTYILSALFFLNLPPTTVIYTLPLHDALPILGAALLRASCKRLALNIRTDSHIFTLPRWSKALRKFGTRKFTILCISDYCISHE